MKLYTPILAIVGIVALELVALQHGVDGTALAAAIGALGAVGGYLAKVARVSNGKTGA